MPCHNVLKVLLCLLTGCGQSVSDLGSQHQAIVGGSADAGVGRSDVFLIGMTFLPDAGGSICSAALVGSRTLVTAAHCIDPARRGAAEVRIIAVNRATDRGLVGADIHRMTDYRLHPLWTPTVESASYDIAMVLLDRVPPSTPRQIARAAPSVGQSITLVGYGRDDPARPNTSGVRRAAAATITSVAAESFGFGVAATLGICGGDSGGPTLRVFPDQIERIIGLHSTTPDPSICGDGVDTRVDFHAGFIDTFLREKDPPPVPDAGLPDAGLADAGAGDGGSGGGTEPATPASCGCHAGPASLLGLAGWLLSLRRGLRRRSQVAALALPKAARPPGCSSMPSALKSSLRIVSRSAL